MKLKVYGRRRAALGTVMAAAALLAACGGGSQVETFAPRRILAFGDETSVIENNGHKYSINALKSDGTYDCASNPIWIQSLANHYGLVFPQCNPTAVASPQSVIYAQNGALAADVTTQITNHLNAGTGFGAKDLVTILAGANDIVAQYQRYPATSEAVITASLQQTAAALAAQVNRVAEAGGKVLIATVPNLGLSPYAVAQSVGDTTRAALLTRLTNAYNEELRFKLTNDGRKIGLVLPDELVGSMARFPASYGLVATTAGISGAACTVALPDCTTATLKTDPETGVAATATTWLWADNLRLSAGGQGYIGSIAITRATGNPF